MLLWVFVGLQEPGAFGKAGNALPLTVVFYINDVLVYVCLRIPFLGRPGLGYE